MNNFNPASAKKKIARMVTIKRRDDFVVLQLKPDQKIFCMRERDGSITVIWEGNNVEVESFGSAVERRARYSKHIKKKAKSGALP